jgi:hypothetical protein
MKEIEGLRGKGKLISPKNGRYCIGMAKLNPNCNLVFFSIGQAILSLKSCLAMVEKNLTCNLGPNWT